MITYCIHQMLILQHASLFQICNAVTISSEIKPLPFHTVAPNLHEKRCPSRSPYSNVTSALSHPLHFVTVSEPLQSGIRSSTKFEAIDLPPAPHLWGSKMYKRLYYK